MHTIWFRKASHTEQESVQASDIAAARVCWDAMRNIGWYMVSARP